MQIYSVLKSDHKQIKQVLKQLDATSEEHPNRRKALLKQLKLVLVPHSRAEEQVLYDRLKHSKVKEADLTAFEGYEEHAIVDRLMEQLETSAADDTKWTARAGIVKELVEHHMKEEEDETFEKARKSFDQEEAATMSEEFSRLKKTFLDELKEGKTPQQTSSDEYVEAA